MNRREFMGLLFGVAVAPAVAVTVTPEPEEEIRPWSNEEVEAFLAQYEGSKPDFALAA